MFKNGYKIIFIKEGKFDLKQFTISPLQVGLIAGTIVLLTSSFFFMFSDRFVKWAGSHEIEKHRKNNKVLIQNIEENQERIENLLDELNELKKQDDILRRLVKLPPIHDDIRKMGFGGTHNKTETEDVNYLLPEDNIDVDDIVNGLIKMSKDDWNGEIFNLGTGRNHSINELAELFNPKSIEYIPKRPGEPDCTWADISKVKKLLKWSPTVSIEQGIKNLLDNIDYWSEAPVWDANSISIATKKWFEYLG